MPPADDRRRAVAALRFRALGDETHGPEIVSLRWTPDPRLASHHAVLLPILHPYEQTGTIVNLEGRVQELRAGGRFAGEARPDWAVLAELGRALGINPAAEGIQAALA